MKKILAQLKEILFYGKVEGTIECKKTYVNYYTGIYYKELQYVLLSKKVKIGNKTMKKTKQIVVLTKEIEKFNIGDYYSLA